MDTNFDKTLSRLAAIQILYMLDSKGEFIIDDVEKAIENMQKYYTELYSKNEVYKKLNSKFLKRLVKLTVQNLTEIDSIINTNLDKERTDAKVNNLLKAILRNGICEILYFKTPPKVSIDEYVKITKDFFKPEEAGFVNALLDKVVKKMSFKA
ncbi:MAG: transcription antitermination factor NusB [Rickettsiales bacterium]|nr:transcription antitermination factor NusB [Rickettsiales bacterium]